MRPAQACISTAADLFAHTLGSLAVMSTPTLVRQIHCEIPLDRISHTNYHQFVAVDTARLLLGRQRVSALKVTEAYERIHLVAKHEGGSWSPVATNISVVIQIGDCMGCGKGG